MLETDQGGPGEQPVSDSRSNQPSPFDSIRERYSRMHQPDQLELGFTDLELPVRTTGQELGSPPVRASDKPLRPGLNVNVQSTLQSIGFHYTPASGSAPPSAIPFATERRRHDRLTR
ncbi:MAG: hypothetical protein AAB922_06540 [Patescibacteria group bacterium]